VEAAPPLPEEPTSLDEYLNGHEAPPVRASPSPEPPPKPRPVAPPASSGDLQGRAVAALREGAHDFIASTVQHAKIEESGGEVVLHVTAEDRTTLEFDWKTVEEAVRAAAGRPVRVKLGSDLAETEVVRNVSSDAADEPSPVENEASQRALEDPDVKTFQQLFPGQVREVRNLREFS
jgi:hypothetical protein